MSKAFDLSHIRLKVREMNSEQLCFKWYKEHPIEPSGKFSFLLPRLFKFAESMEHSVYIQDPQRFCGGRDVGKVLGLCQTDRWDGEGRIYLHPDLSADERCRVLIHEITHGLGASCSDFGTDEITAETVAHLVCREFGLDTWDFTYPYLAYHWHCKQGNFKTGAINLYANEILSTL